jgi:hypothetical protein
MKAIRYMGLVFLAVIIAGCSSKPYVVTDYDAGYDFASLKTFSVQEPRQGSQENLLISPFTFSHIHSVVEQEFSQRYKEVGGELSPDFIVSYHIVIEEKLDPGSYDRLYGFGGYGYGRGYRAYPSPLFYGTTGGPRVYNQGSLIIDLVDAETKNPIWRGVSEKRLRKSLAPSQQREILTNAVREVLAQFPPI